MPVETTTPLLGRCKGRDCNFALFATSEDVREAESFNDVKPGLAYHVNNGFFGRCPNGHKVFALKRVKGTYSPDHKCDSRCLNARGHDCTCSCGGANHGRGHAVTVTAGHEPSFIGEVGKYIVGNVTVAGIKDLGNHQGTTLFTFTTEKGDVIKWFCPAYVAEPTFERGEKVQIRARVKRHEDNNNQYGKSTIVTYVERIES